MKHLVIWVLLLSLGITNNSYAQQKLVSDIDFDKVNDTAYIDVETATVVCRLSSQQFKKIQSQRIETLNGDAYIEEARNGFKFINNWMRSGYRSQFRYDKKTGRIRLIGMERYEFGPANNDGSGESSVNLLTGDYIGDWNYFDVHANKGKGALIKMPSIKAKMWFPKTYLDSFGEAINADFGDRCSNLYRQHKKEMIRKGSGKKA